ncbi:MAG: tail fiber protein [Xanthobacteraceae bacterium]|jgi:microcystin-dependent protein
MSEPFLGEIKIISWNFPPKGWAFCNGQLLPINQNQALFSILGTTYGGDGLQTFGLPNLQGRMPVHVGNGIVLGQLAGETAHTLNIGEIPTHTHFLAADPAAASSDTPDPAGGKALAQSSGSGGSPPAPFAANIYSSAGANSNLNPACVSFTGGNQPHDNMSPYLVLNFIVALQGIFPSRN